MIIAAAHHRINRRWLFFARIRVVWIVTWDNEIVHFFLENLFASSILDIASRCSSAILATHIVLFILYSILHTKVCVAIEFLSTWTVFVSGAIEYLALLRYNTHWINHHREVFFEVCG